MNKPPFAELDFAPMGVEVERRGDGTMVLRSPIELGDCPPNVPAMLHRWADEDPDRLWIAERSAPPVTDAPWRRVSYGEGGRLAWSLGQAFLDLGVGPERPVMLLSDNSVDNALVQLGAMQTGVPAAPISQAYSLMSEDHGKLKYIFELLTPGLLYAADGARFAAAFAALDPGETPILVSAHPQPGQLLLSDLMKTEPGAAVRQAYAAVGSDTVAKVLFTSGSTGMPKGVINLHSMLTSNVVAMAQVWPFLKRRPPVLVDWLPWSHTFGGNHNFNTILLHGGAFYVDNGKPAPGLIEQTVANLKEVSPTLCFNVPRGFDVLIPFLEADEALRTNFFKELDFVFYAGAALPPVLWAKLEELSIKARGDRVAMLSSWGSTETAPASLTVHWLIEKAGVIGVPMPGTEVKMAPVGAKKELRVRGANVTPGYWRRPDLTEAGFDEEGFFMMGDAGRLEDENDPAKGVVFDGRTAENFKLMSGTWVHTGELRLKVIDACAPAIADTVLTGHDREEIGLLIFPNPAGCAALAEKELPLSELVRHPAVRARVEAGLAAHNQGNPASSRRIARALLLAAPPDIDANEITDKGYINQRAVLDNRADLVEKLYAGDDPEIIEVP